MRSDGQAFKARRGTPNKNGRSLNGRSDFVWFKVLALQIATHQYNRREPTAEQHCGWSARAMTDRKHSLWVGRRSQFDFADGGVRRDWNIYVGRPSAGHRNA